MYPGPGASLGTISASLVRLSAANLQTAFLTSGFEILPNQHLSSRRRSATLYTIAHFSKTLSQSIARLRRKHQVASYPPTFYQPLRHLRFNTTATTSTWISPTLCTFTIPRACRNKEEARVEGDESSDRDCRAGRQTVRAFPKPESRSRTAR